MARLILIADDSPIIQRKAQRILQDAGFEVQTVSNGVAAVKKLPALQPALVLADVSMPGKDGYEVCEFVKTSASLLHVPVLLVGSDLEPYDEQRGERVRADGIIKKPFTPQDLIAVVTRLMGPVETPESPLAQADMTVAPTPLPEAPVESDERLNLVAPGGPEAQEHPEEAPGGLPELSLAPSMPFPGFAPEPSREVEESRSRGAEESANREVGESSSQEFEGLILTPQLLDLIAPEPLPEPGMIIAESMPEPVTAIGPQAALVGPEPGREVEESRSQGVEESANREVGESRPQEFGGLVLPPQLLDLTAPEGLPEPGHIITEPMPDQVTAIEHEPTLASFEASREVEESRSQGVEESISRDAEEFGDRAVEEASSQEVEESMRGALEELGIPSVEDAEPRIAGESISASQLLDSSSSRLPDSLASQPLNSSTAQLPDSATTLDPEWVYKVVHKVVTRMAPPVLAPEQLEELARKLTDEITTELGGAPRPPGLFISP